MNSLALSILPITFLLFALPVVIGVYVYKDSSRRGMNALIWTLIAVLAPAFTGFILYLLARTSNHDLHCPRCGTRVQEEYISCPQCGAPFRDVCPVCSYPVQPDWKVCPHCAHDLPMHRKDVFTPVHPKDKTLWKIIAAVVIIPVLIFAVMTLSLSVINSSGAAGVTSLPVHEYLEEIDHFAEIESILTRAQEEKRGCVLRYAKPETQDSAQEYQYLVYLPQLTDFPQLSLHPKSGFLSDTLKVELERTAGNTGNTVLIIHASDKKLNLIDFSGKVEYEYIEFSYPLDWESYYSSVLPEENASSAP